MCLFVWQEESFMLTMGHEMDTPPGRIHGIPSPQRTGHPYLHGKTRFGYNIDDEWPHILERFTIE